MKKNNSPLRIAITTGDPDGIGPEVTVKALAKIGPQKNVIFYIWRSTLFPQKYLRVLDKKFHRVTVSSWQEAQSVVLKRKKI